MFKFELWDNDFRGEFFGLRSKRRKREVCPVCFEVIERGRACEDCGTVVHKECVYPISMCRNCWEWD